MYILRVALQNCREMRQGITKRIEHVEHCRRNLNLSKLSEQQRIELRQMQAYIAAGEGIVADLKTIELQMQKALLRDPEEYDRAYDQLRIPLDEVLKRFKVWIGSPPPASPAPDAS